MSYRRQHHPVYEKLNLFYYFGLLSIHPSKTVYSLTLVIFSAPSGNKAKHRWSQEHSDLIRSEFYSIASAKKSISGNTIREFCKVHKITKNIADVRSHLQYLVSKSQPKKTKTNSPGSRRKRNIVQDYICNRKEPTIAECVIAYQNSPEGLVRNYPPSRIQELVRIAIEFDDD